MEKQINTENDNDKKKNKKNKSKKEEILEVDEEKGLKEEQPEETTQQMNKEIFLNFCKLSEHSSPNLLDTPFLKRMGENNDTIMRSFEEIEEEVVSTNSISRLFQKLTSCCDAGQVLLWDVPTLLNSITHLVLICIYTCVATLLQARVFTQLGEFKFTEFMLPLTLCLGVWVFFFNFIFSAKVCANRFKKISIRITSDLYFDLTDLRLPLVKYEHELLLKQLDGIPINKNNKNIHKNNDKNNDKKNVG
eukprot:GHVR01101962.1.p1 GENE.GHVR01101962.1~~GHVR01101962.1.p1  ORF type:complete len:248 (+),score=63.49 GHVR01101962.1:84-827(+)